MPVSPTPSNTRWLVLTEHDPQFKDELVKQGIEGGKRTACLLKQAVGDELRSSARAPAAHVQVMARVYANVKGLGKTYKDANVLPRSECLNEFIRGFNMGDALCDYVDAGIGKECSDEKVKGESVFPMSSAQDFPRPSF